MDNLAQIATIRKSLLDALAPVITPHPSYALVDFPNYSNVGDSAIWLGQVQIMCDMGLGRPSYVSEISDFCAKDLMRFCPKGPIYIIGGGNFGDIWPEHQDFRIFLLKNFKDRPVVQFPQSIWFRDMANIRATKEAIASHGNFTMFVRDRNSLEFAQEHLGCPAILAPDAAFGMGHIDRPHTPCLDTLFLLRTDKEKRAIDWPDLGQQSASSIVDWLEERGRPLRIAGIEHKIRSRIGDPAFARFHYFQRLATIRLQRGLALLSKGRVVVTDRLHAHVLSFLMDIPHVVLDNDYGKVSSFIAAWTSGSDLVATANDPDEALRLKDRLRILAER